MKVTVNARHMEATDAIKQYVENKVAKLPRLYDSVQSVEVILGHEKEKSTVEIVVAAKRKHTFVATHRDDNMYASVDQCLAKIEEQIRRFKDKVRDRQGPSHGDLVEETPAE